MMKKDVSYKGGRQMLKKLLLLAAVSVAFAVLMMLPAYAEGENVIKNGDFEQSTGSLPSYWRFEAFSQDPGVTKYGAEGNSYNGSKCFTVENIQKNDVKLVQDVKVELGKLYRITFWIKAENFDPGNPAGGNLTILNGIFESDQITDTKGQWKKVESYARVRSAGNDIMNVALRVGGFGTTTKGKAYFDDVSMVLVDNAPAGVTVKDFFVPNANTSNNAASTDKGSGGGTSKILIIVIVIVVVVGLLVFVEIKFAKRGHKDGEDTEDDEEENDEEDNEEDEEDEDDEKPDSKNYD